MIARRAGQSVTLHLAHDGGSARDERLPDAV